MEIWKPVVGYEGLYEVSSHGRVKSLDRKGTDGRNIKGKLLSINGIKNPNTPYLQVSLYKDNIKKSIKVHRLVASAFLINEIEGLSAVNHIDGNKKNNNVDNLEWVSYVDNMKHARETGLMTEAFKAISLTHSKKLKVKNLITSEVIEFKNRIQFSEHLGYEGSWFSKNIKSIDKINKKLLKFNYELISY